MEASSKESFKIKLTEFFERHDPSRVFLVPKIVEKFSDHQGKVFEHLTKLYADKEGRSKISDDSILSVIPPPHEGAEPV
jgi:hypothetical protein